MFSLPVAADPVSDLNIPTRDITENYVRLDWSLGFDVVMLPSLG